MNILGRLYGGVIVVYVIR